MDQRARPTPRASRTQSTKEAAMKKTGMPAMPKMPKPGKMPMKQMPGGMMKSKPPKKRKAGM